MRAIKKKKVTKYLGKVHLDERRIFLEFLDTGKYISGAEGKNIVR